MKARQKNDLPQERLLVVGLKKDVDHGEATQAIEKLGARVERIDYPDVAEVAVPRTKVTEMTVRLKSLVEVRFVEAA